MSSVIRSIVKILAVLMVTVASPAVGQAPSPANYPNFETDYMAALDKSSDPQSAAIRKEIANGPASLARECAECRERNISLARTIPNVQRDQNAYFLYKHWKDLQTNQSAWLPYYAKPLSLNYKQGDKQIAVVQRYISDHAHLYKLAHRAAKLKYALAPPGDAAANMRQRNAATDLSTEAFILAHQGKYADAISVQTLGLNIATQRTDGAASLDFVMQCAEERISLAGFQDIMSMAGPNQTVDTEVQSAIQRSLPVLSLKGLLTDEMSESLSQFNAVPTSLATNGIVYFQDTGAGVASSLRYRVRRRNMTSQQRMFMNNLCFALEAAYLRQLITLYDALNSSQKGQSAVLSSIDVQNARAASNPSLSRDPIAFWLGTASPNYGDLRRTYNLSSAYRQVALATASILDTKAKTGHYPSSIPATFTDPFTGKPLKYAKIGNRGFIVYSSGRTGVYDGKSPNPGEVYFRYPAFPARPLTPDMLELDRR